MGDLFWAIIIVLWIWVVEILNIWLFSREEKKLNNKIKELEYQLWRKENELEILMEEKENGI